jgi:flavin reductase (DIM6/NTAB) family NADH-FMN oxidoreductase RutF
MDIDTAPLAWTDAYHLLVGAIVPRPIAWVSTTAADGVQNIAPFSFFMGVCAKPMLLAFAPMRFFSGERKDTLANIEATGEFVVNVVTEPRLQAMDATSEEFDAEVDEFSAVGLTPAPSAIVKPPRIAESPINMECVLETALHFGTEPGGGSLVIGRVVHVWVSDDVLNAGRIDATLLRPVARMAGPLYSRPELLAFKRRAVPPRR